MREWLPLALGTIVLNPRAYAEVVRRPLMTGPALLIPLLMAIFVGALKRGGFYLVPTVEALLSFALSTGIVFLTGRVLNKGRVVAGDKKAVTYGGVVRALGFAEGVLIVDALSLIPVIGSFASTLTTLLRVIAVWIAAAVAHDLRGWRAVVFPIVMFLVLVVSLVVTITLLRGAALSLTTILQELGLSG